MKKILIFGSINVDHVYFLDKLPNKGQCVFSKEFKLFCGGKGANQAIACAKLDGDATMVGSVGDDEGGKTSILNLEVNKVNVNNIAISKSHPTGVANIFVDNNGDNILIVDVGANFAFKKNDIDKYKELINTCDIIVSQLEITIDFVEEILAYANKQNKTVILNPAPARKLGKKILSYCDYIIPNESELAVLVDKPYTQDLDIIKKYAQELQKMSDKDIIVTIGEKGCLWLEKNDKLSHIGAYVVDSVDTTAAGDTFIGGFATKLAKGESVINAIKFATAASALTVQTKGAQSAIPNYQSVENFIKKNGEVRN